jgi:hypothetical protein
MRDLHPSARLAPAARLVVLAAVSAGCLSAWSSLDPRRDGGAADRVASDVAGDAMPDRMDVPVPPPDAPVAPDAFDAPPVDAPPPVYTRYAVQWSAGASFIDACAMPGAVHVVTDSDDSVVESIMPFPFTFFALTQDHVWISTNGLAAFSNPPQFTSVHHCEMQDCNAWSNAVFAYFNDLVTRANGVCAAWDGVAPRQRFVMTWSDTSQFIPPPPGVDWAPDPDTHLNFTIVLHEGTHEIEVVFGTMQGAMADGLAFTGIRSPLCLMTADFACHTGAIVAGSRAQYTPQP